MPVPVSALSSPPDDSVSITQPTPSLRAPDRLRTGEMERHASPLAPRGAIDAADPSGLFYS